MFDARKFEKASLMAIQASIRTIRPFLLGQKEIGLVKIKKDETLLTVADRLSENAGFRILREAFPDVPIVREESGLSSGSANWEIWYDPIDGTAPFTIGAPTSTVICAAYDTENHMLLAAAIGEPAYKRAWIAIRGQGCRFLALGQNNSAKTCRVWPGKMKSDTAVFLDLTRGFARDKGKRQILTNEQVQELVKSLCLDVRLQMYGSNGIHQALVAHGNEKVVGGITTAMGGPWDAAGALLIAEAGGKCVSYRMDSSRQLFSTDPLDPMTYDILVYANNNESFRFLNAKIDGII